MYDMFAHKMTQFWAFSPKMTYFDQIDSINDSIDKFYDNKPDWNNFWDCFRLKIFTSLAKLLTYDVILALKMTQFWPFSRKMRCLEKMTYISYQKFRTFNFGTFNFRTLNFRAEKWQISDK